LLVLSRGFGQNALSVVSLTIPGHWFARRLSLAMAIYSVSLSIGFMAAFPIVSLLVDSQGWRFAWGAIGWSLVVVLAPVGWLLTRPAPRGAELAAAGEAAPADAATGDATAGFTWGQALRSPVFWVFALSSSLYNLLASGIGLFNQSILTERGFETDIYRRSLVITALTSLLGNFLGGWLATKWQLNHLMALAMGLLGLALLGLPSLTAVWHVDVFSAVMGVAGGFVIVLFFTAWPKLFGRAHLGRIQGTAQMLTVVASAIGPLVLAKCHAWTGSYAAIFYSLAGVVALLGFAAWRVRVAQPQAALSV
ncbi:MAG TPA: MFS transporter, partial [Opitutaceae bacterium]